MDKLKFEQILKGKHLYWSFGDCGCQNEACYIWSDKDDTELDDTAPEWMREFMLDYFGADEDCEHLFVFERMEKNKQFRKFAIHKE